MKFLVVALLVVAALVSETNAITKKIICSSIPNGQSATKLASHNITVAVGDTEVLFSACDNLRFVDIKIQVEKRADADGNVQIFLNGLKMNGGNLQMEPANGGNELRNVEVFVKSCTFKSVQNALAIFGSNVEKVGVEVSGATTASVSEAAFSVLATTNVVGVELIATDSVKAVPDLYGNQEVSKMLSVVAENMASINITVSGSANITAEGIVALAASVSHAMQSMSVTALAISVSGTSTVLAKYNPTVPCPYTKCARGISAAGVISLGNVFLNGLSLTAFDSATIVAIGGNVTAALGVAAFGPDQHSFISSSDVTITAAGNAQISASTSFAIDVDTRSMAAVAAAGLATTGDSAAADIFVNGGLININGVGVKVTATLEGPYGAAAAAGYAASSMQLFDKPLTGGVNTTVWIDENNGVKPQIIVSSATVKVEGMKKLPTQAANRKSGGIALAAAGIAADSYDEMLFAGTPLLVVVDTQVQITISNYARIYLVALGSYGAYAAGGVAALNGHDENFASRETRGSVELSMSNILVDSGNIVVEAFGGAIAAAGASLSQHSAQEASMIVSGHAVSITVTGNSKVSAAVYTKQHALVSAAGLGCMGFYWGAAGKESNVELTALSVKITVDSTSTVRAYALNYPTTAGAHYVLNVASLTVAGFNTTMYAQNCLLNITEEAKVIASGDSYANHVSLAAISQVSLTTHRPIANQFLSAKGTKVTISGKAVLSGGGRVGTLAGISSSSGSVDASGVSVLVSGSNQYSKTYLRFQSAASQELLSYTGNGVVLGGILSRFSLKADQAMVGVAGQSELFAEANVHPTAVAGVVCYQCALLSGTNLGVAITDNATISATLANSTTDDEDAAVAVAGIAMQAETDKTSDMSLTHSRVWIGGTGLIVAATTVPISAVDGIFIVGGWGIDKAVKTLTSAANQFRSCGYKVSGDKPFSVNIVDTGSNQISTTPCNSSPIPPASPESHSGAIVAVVVIVILVIVGGAGFLVYRQRGFSFTKRRTALRDVPGADLGSGMYVGDAPVRSSGYGSAA